MSLIYQNIVDTGHNVETGHALFLHYKYNTIYL